MDKEIQKDIVFQYIIKKIQGQFKYYNYQKLKTIAGNTQKAERKYIDIIRTVLKEDGFDFNEAGPQASKDFRIMINKNITLNLECKKTDSFTILFNDTCPSRDIYYVFIFTGKEYVIKPPIKPQIIYINGYEMIKDSPWHYEFKKELNLFRDKWARGENAKKLPGLLHVYPRPTYSVNIRHLLDTT